MFDFAKALAYHTQIPSGYLRIAGIDSETTGVHMHHDSLPFMFSITYDDGESILYTAEVDPLTRIPVWDSADLKDFERRINDSSVLKVFSNAKFDVRSSTKLGISLDPVQLLRQCHDTIFEHHGLNNVESHALKDAAVKYAKITDTDESDLHKACNEARLIGSKLGWKIANKINCPQQRRAPDSKKGKGGWAVMDMWLPRAVARHNWRNSAAYKYLVHLVKASIDATVTLLTVSFEQLKEAFTTASKAVRSELRGMEGWLWRPDGIYGAGHKWWTLCGKYCSMDTLRSVVLNRMFLDALKGEGLYNQYLENRTALNISYQTEELGVTINTKTAKDLIDKFRIEAEDAKFALNAALGVKVPIKPTSPVALRNIFYKYFKLPVTRYTKPKGEKSIPQPTTDADFIASVVRDFSPEVKAEAYAPPTWHRGVEPYADFRKRLDTWHDILVAEEKPSQAQLFGFATSLLMYKKSLTSITQLEGYLHACKPLPNTPDFAILHPSLNPIGTKTTRYSSSNPNGQNVSKGGKGKKGLEWLFKKSHSLRSVFGPAAGREWWSFDYHQIQLVVFAILCGDPKMVDAVYAGRDFHTFVAMEIFGISSVDEWKELSDEQRSYYRDIAKTVNFAFVFGAQEEKLNRTAGIEGLYDILGNTFPYAIDFLQRTEWEVRDRGFVLTPGGTRLFIPEETPYAGVNYKVQGAEGEIMKRAQYGLQAYLEAKRSYEREIFMSMYIHDDVVFDAEQGKGFPYVGPICRIMADAASSFGFPVHVEPKIITTNWAEPKKLQAL